MGSCSDSREHTLHPRARPPSLPTHSRQRAALLATTRQVALENDRRGGAVHELVPPPARHPFRLQPFAGLQSRSRLVLQLDGNNKALAKSQDHRLDPPSASTDSGHGARNANHDRLRLPLTRPGRDTVGHPCGTTEGNGREPRGDTFVGVAHRNPYPLRPDVQRQPSHGPRIARVSGFAAMPQGTIASGMEGKALAIDSGKAWRLARARGGAWLAIWLALAPCVASADQASGTTPTQPAPVVSAAAPSVPPPTEPAVAAPTQELPVPTAPGQVAPPQTISLQATHQQMVEDQFICAQGNVRISYQDIRLQCDVIELDQKTMVVKASGNVVLDQAGTRMACDRLEFDLVKKTGTLYKVDAFLPPTYSFRGAELEKLDETHYRFHDGVFTSCSLTDDSPPWSIEISDATVEQEGYGHFRGVSLRVQGVPVFYTPRLLWPVKRDRAAGLMVPNIGYNNRRGAYLGNAFFWPISRSVDTTAYLDLYSEGWVGIGDEARWAPTDNARGQLLLYALKDPDGRWEWKAFGRHSQLFAGGYSIKAELQEISDIDFFQEFERTFDRNTMRTLYSYLTLTRNWGSQSLNLRTDHRRTFFSTSVPGTQTTVILDRLPELEYRLRSTRVGTTPLYLSLVALADQLRVDRSATLYGRYGRFDLFPTVSLLTPGFPWLSITPTVGARETYYTAQYSRTRTTLVSEPLSRLYWTGGVSLVGPSISRVWNLESNRKIKHLLEPRIEYSYVSNPGDVSRIPVFDEKDSVLVTNRLRWYLANRLFYKQGETGSREVASLELSQEYSFSDLFPAAGSGLEPSRRGPFTIALRTSPWLGSNLDVRADFEPVTKNLRGTAVTGGVSKGGSSLGLTWYASYNPVTEKAVSSQTRLYGALAPGNGRWRLEAQAAYDIHNQLLMEERFTFRWRGSCWTAYAEFRDYRIEPYKTRDYRIAIDLTGLGTFLDIHGGLDSDN